APDHHSFPTRRSSDLNRPASDQEQRIEWSQFLVFAGVWALLLSLGLESWQPIAAAGVLFAAALVYAFSAGNVSFAVAALLVAIVDRKSTRLNSSHLGI